MTRGRMNRTEMLVYWNQSAIGTVFYTTKFMTSSLAGRMIWKDLIDLSPSSLEGRTFHMYVEGIGKIRQDLKWAFKYGLCKRDDLTGRQRKQIAIARANVLFGGTQPRITPF